MAHPSLIARIYPELALLPDIKSRREVLSVAQAEIYRRPTLYLLFVGVIGVVFASYILLPKIGLPPAYHTALVSIGNFVIVLSMPGGMWLFRRSIRRSLRVQLRERGHLLCITCGYDLRGVASNRCPECGTPINRVR